MTYNQKMQDPRWQRCRLTVLNEYCWTCINCGDKEKTLHVHHKKYRYGADPWDYKLSEFAVLCDDCHTEEHKAITRKKLISMLDSVIEEYACTNKSNASQIVDCAIYLKEELI